MCVLLQLLLPPSSWPSTRQCRIRTMLPKHPNDGGEWTGCCTLGFLGGFGEPRCQIGLAFSMGYALQLQTSLYISFGRKVTVSLSIHSEDITGIHGVVTDIIHIRIRKANHVDGYFLLLHFSCVMKGCPTLQQIQYRLYLHH